MTVAIATEVQFVYSFSEGVAGASCVSGTVLEYSAHDSGQSVCLGLSRGSTRACVSVSCVNN